MNEYHTFLSMNFYAFINLIFMNWVTNGKKLNKLVRFKKNYISIKID